MRMQVSRRNVAESEDLVARVEALVASLPGVEERVSLAKISLERQEPSTCALAVILARSDGGEALVRHAAAPDWDRALLELERKLVQAWEDEAAATPPAG